MIKELILVYQKQGNIEILAYYKMKNGYKIYYDFQETINFSPLYRYSEIMGVEELLYYLREQVEILKIR